MRMWVTVIAVGIAVVGLGIPKADAVLTLRAGQLEFSLIDTSSFYNYSGTPHIDHAGNPLAVEPAYGMALPQGALPNVGDRLRAIFYVNTITQIPTHQEIYTAPPPGSPGTELTGILSGLEVIAVNATPGLLGSTIAMGPSPDPWANPAGVVDVDAPNQLTDVNSPLLPAAYGANAGGRVQLFEDNTSDRDFSGLLGTPTSAAPDQWGVPSPDGDDPAAVEIYPTFTDGSLWLDGMFLPTINPMDPATAVLTITITDFGGPMGTLNLEGVSGGDINIIGGSYEHFIVRNVNGPFSDVTYNSTLAITDGSGIYNPDMGIAAVTGWQAQSADPINLSVIPEPLTMSMTTIVLVGLAGYLRRKRRAAD